MKVRFGGEQCEVEVYKYADSGMPAIVLTCEDGEVMAKATTNLPEEYERIGKPANKVFIKDWSENTGIYDALLAAGVIGPCEAEIATGHVVALLCPLLFGLSA